jgi:hypothetical protein
MLLSYLLAGREPPGRGPGRVPASTAADSRGNQPMASIEPATHCTAPFSRTTCSVSSGSTATRSVTAGSARPPVSLPAGD